MNEIWLGNKKMEEKKSVTAKIAKYIKKYTERKMAGRRKNIQ